MSRWTRTRRGLLAALGAGVTGFAGCAGWNDTADETDGPDDVEPTDLVARRERMPDPDVAVDWADVREFRKWLIDDGNRSNGRFDYTADLPPAGDADSPVLEVLDGYPDRVDGLLSQPPTQTVLGAFEVDDLESELEESDRFDVRDEYRGYVVADVRGDEGDGDGGDDPAGTIAAGEDAVVIGAGYEAPIDARHGDRSRLEDVDPWMTHLLETLPDEALVTGEYLTPVGGVEIDEIYCWGMAMPERGAETGTWAFVFDDPDDITDDVRSDVRTLAAEVDDLEADGRTLTMTGTVPEPPGAGESESRGDGDGDGDSDGE